MGKIPWRREWQPTPVFLPGEFHGQRSPAGYSPWGHQALNTTEGLTLSTFKRSVPALLCPWQERPLSWTPCLRGLRIPPTNAFAKKHMVMLPPGIWDQSWHRPTYNPEHLRSDWHCLGCRESFSTGLDSEQKAIVSKALKVCGLCFCSVCLGVWGGFLAVDSMKMLQGEKRQINYFINPFSQKVWMQKIPLRWDIHSLTVLTVHFPPLLSVLVCTSRDAGEFAPYFQWLIW